MRNAQNATYEEDRPRPELSMGAEFGVALGGLEQLSLHGLLEFVSRFGVAGVAASFPAETVVETDAQHAQLLPATIPAHLEEVIRAEHSQTPVAGASAGLVEIVRSAVPP